MDEQTIFELLEIYDAVNELEKLQELLVGISVSVGPGEGILGNLSYVSDIIIRHSALTDTNEILQILHNTALDNHAKARILVG